MTSEARTDAESVLRRAWPRGERPFDVWVLSVADAFEASLATVEYGARTLGVTTAEIEAVLHLSMMERDDLAKLAPQPPPKNTWFLLAGTTSEGIDAALEALAHGDGTESSTELVRSAIRETEGPDVLERVGQLPSDLFWHVARKAKQYNKLSTRARGALGDFAKRRAKAEPLSQKQAAWAVTMLSTLADAGAISRESPDDDQEVCDVILDALGRG